MWNKSHRLYCEDIPVSSLRLFSPSGLSEFLTKGGRFKGEKYVQSVRRIQDKIKKLKKVPRGNMDQSIFDQRSPEVVDLNSAKDWVVKKFEMVTKFKNVELPKLGHELEFFSGIRVDIGLPDRCLKGVEELKNDGNKADGNISRFFMKESDLLHAFCEKLDLLCKEGRSEELLAELSLLTASG